jgi:glycosyltransferase involved in cell wall biosynthesis
MKLSIIIPIYNEVDNIPLLYRELDDILEATPWAYELIFVDDGSRDDSFAKLQELHAHDPAVHIVRFRRNYGQTAAMQAGLEHATGDVIITMDGDLQNDPADIPRMVEYLEAGYDLAHGWRKDRQDDWLSRKLPSRIANALIAWSTKFPIHDLGCTLKAMRREIADELELYGQMHRFIPILAAQRGARCIEVVTNHRARQFGTSKYGISRTLQVLLDLCTVKYMLDYFANPMRLFGKWAAACFGCGGAALITTLYMKLAHAIDMTGNPLLLLAICCWLTSIQLLSLGLLGEVAARIYYRRDGNRPFAVAERIGFHRSRRPLQRVPRQAA